MKVILYIETLLYMVYDKNIELYCFILSFGDIPYHYVIDNKITLTM